MSELIAPQQQLASALNQLAQASQNGQLNYQQLDTIVRQITSSQVVLARGDVEISLPRQQLRGELQAGGTYQTQLLPQQNANPQTNSAITSQPILRFLAPSDLSLNVPLSRPQSQSLILSLPNTAIRQIADTSQIISGRIIQVSANAITVDVSSTNATQAGIPASDRLVLNVPNALQNYSTGQNVQIRLNPENRQLSILLNATNQLSRNIPLLEATAQNLNSQGNTTVTSPTSLLNVFSSRALNIPLLDVIPALKKAASTLSNNANFNSLNTHTATNLKVSSQEANVPRAENPSSRLSFTSNGVLISTRVNTEQATLNQITAPQLKQLKTLSITANQPNTAAEKVDGANRPSRAVDNTVVGSNNNTPVSPTSETRSENFLRQLNTSGRSQEILNQVQTLIRHSRPLSEAPSKTLESIGNALLENNLVEDPLLNKVVKDVKPQLSQGLPGSVSDGSEVVRQLLTLPPASLTSSSLSTPAPNNSLISGLVGLLQITLASRLAKSGAKSLERATQALAPILATPGIAKPTKQQVAKSLNEISQADQKHALLKELGRFFVSHQNNKLSSIEQQLNGQEGLYYVLPSALGEQRKDIELLIKRKQDEDGEKSKGDKNIRSWHINMKLDAGSKGELLAKARLREKEVEVDFYTSNNELKNLVLNFLPLLKKKLQELGIQLTKSQCQLGKIPASLQRKPYQILETRV
ncbi:flagellar hook-length control protein FliK [Alteromonadaceae bacterium M269]|nr:flagellar hook-length control protein FliK [Alteromonadaceae bacterium M269]